MSAYNVVRMRVKPGREEEFIKINNTFPEGMLDKMKANGFRHGAVVKTGDRRYCFLGEWDSMDAIVKSRPDMIKDLDRMRDLLEDLGSDLGVTDPVSGETAVEFGEATSTRNIEIVKSIYASFAKGDVNAILAVMHENVEWEYGTVDNGVPWLARRRGPEGVAKFFQTLADTTELKSFAVDDIVGNDRVVVGLARVEAVVKATGKLIREEAEPHIWHFNSRGQVMKFRHAADTFAHVRACQK